MIKLEVLEQLSHSFVRVITWFRVQFGMNQHEQIFKGTPICILWKIYECLFIHTGGPSSRLEKKPAIKSWKRHALCDSVLSYERNRWKFEHVIRINMRKEIWSIYNDKYFEVLKFYTKINSTYSRPVYPL